MTDTGDDTGDGRWMSYDALAELRHISRIGAVRLVQRRKWRRMAGNDGRALVLVPHDMLAPVRGSAAGKGGAEHLSNGKKSAAGDAAANGGGNAAAHAVTVLEAALSALKEAHAGERAALLDRAERAETRAQELEAEIQLAKGQGRWARLRAAWRGG